MLDHSIDVLLLEMATMVRVYMDQLNLSKSPQLIFNTEKCQNELEITWKAENGYPEQSQVGRFISTCARNRSN